MRSLECYFVGIPIDDAQHGWDKWPSSMGKISDNFAISADTLPAVEMHFVPKALMQRHNG